MAEGSFDKLLAEYGKGVPVVGRAVGREILGTSPGAKTKASFWIGVPPASSKVKTALLSIGIELPIDVRPPIRVKIAMGNVSITREFRPQFSVQLDETIYYKALYDIRPILSSRLAQRDLHKVLFFYDSLHPLIVRDISLITIFEHEKSEYYLSVLTGAKSLEPGDVIVEYPEFIWSFNGVRSASLTLHSPYHDSEYEIIVAGSEPVRIVGSGSHVIEKSFSYKGNLIPVSVKYLPARYKFYPKRAVVTDIIVSEIKIPKPKINVKLKDVKVLEEDVVVKVKVSNEGSIEARKIVVSLIGLGVQLSYRKIDLVKPGETISIVLRGKLTRLPVYPNRLQVNVSGIVLGQRVLESLDVKIEKSK